MRTFFVFSILNQNHELFSNKNKKVISKFKIETPERFRINELVSLRSKMYAFECGAESKNKRKRISISYSKNIRFVEYKKCLNGEEYEKGVIIIP